MKVVEFDFDGGGSEVREKKETGKGLVGDGNTYIHAALRCCWCGVRWLLGFFLRLFFFNSLGVY